MLRRGRIPLVALLAVIAIGLSACGGTTSNSSNGSGSAQGTSSEPATSFAKTKFVLHAGLAFGAFHHFIYKPYRAGGLHGFGLVKAGLAGLFAYHEVKVALEDAKSSPLLTRLVSPLTALSEKLQSVGAQLKSGTLDRAAVEATNADVAATGAASKAAGQAINEVTPSASQLAGG